MMLEVDRIYNMDCIEGMKQIDDNSIDLIVTSPPYNIGVDYNSYNDNISKKEYLKFSDRWIKASSRVLKNCGRICINIGELTKKPYFAYITTYCEKYGLNYRNNIIWHIQTICNRQAVGTVNSPMNPFTVNPFQYILIFSKSYGSFKKDIDSDITKDEFWNWTYGIWDFHFEKNKKHPAQFPEELPRRCIKMYSYPNDIVLDCFMGGGTTAVVCKQLNRHFIGFEIDKNYCKIGNERLKQEYINYR